MTTRLLRIADWLLTHDLFRLLAELTLLVISTTAICALVAFGGGQ